MRCAIASERPRSVSKSRPIVIGALIAIRSASAGNVSMRAFSISSSEPTIKSP